MLIAVCDDDAVFRKMICNVINFYCNNICVYQYSNGEDLLKSEEEFDIVFLDIQMSGMDGISCAKRYKESGKEGYLVILTGHNEYIMDGFEADVFRYLIKPCEHNKIGMIIQEVKKRIESRGMVSVLDDGKLRNVYVDNIIMVEAYGDGVYIYVRNGKVYENGETLKIWEEKLRDRQEFYKANKSYIVSMRYIHIYNRPVITMKYCGVDVKVSERNKKNFEKSYAEYMERDNNIL